MLRNELKEIEELLLDASDKVDIKCSATEFHEKVGQVQEAWLNVVFSELPKSGLERYLQFHLEGISKLSDALFVLGFKDRELFQEEILSMIDHLNGYYHQLLNWETRAPEAYRRRFISKLSPVLNKVRNALDSSEIDLLLRNSLKLWLDEIADDQKKVHFTFRSLAYMEKLIRAVSNLNWIAEGLSAKLACLLYQSNFNHLAFLKYLQDEICKTAKNSAAEKGMVDHFQSKLAEFISIPLECNSAYDSSWPTIKTMVTDWLKELVCHSDFEVKRNQENINNLFGSKLGLNMSVAHMACLIKAFYEAEVFTTENLRSVFKFYAASYESKRQPDISWESLSKEYYSLNTQTAAKVKKILQRMIDNLNRGFFPVLAVAGAVLGIYSGIR